MCRKLELIKCENVVAADGGGVWILQESTEMATCAGEVCRVWRGGFLPMCGGCAGGNGVFCVRLRVAGERGGGGELSGACAAEW